MATLSPEKLRRFHQKLLSNCLPRKLHPPPQKMASDQRLAELNGSRCGCVCLLINHMTQAVTVFRVLHQLQRRVNQRLACQLIVYGRRGKGCFVCERRCASPERRAAKSAEQTTDCMQPAQRQQRRNVQRSSLPLTLERTKRREWNSLFSKRFFWGGGTRVPPH